MKKYILFFIAVVVLMISGLLLFFKSDGINPYSETSWGRFVGMSLENETPNDKFGEKFHSCDYSVPTAEIPQFRNAKISYNNVFDNKKSLPLMGSALIDIDNDGVDEIFLAGGISQQDALFKYANGEFIDITDSVLLPKKPEETTTYGAVSFDLDNDGNTDLLLTGDYGLLWLRNLNGQFVPQTIDIPLNDRSVAASVTLGDVNRDGHADIFVSAYIRLDKMEGQTIFKDFNYGASSLMMINRGDNSFRDATEEMGLSYVHNTFMAIMVDVDNDGYLDLVVAHDTGEVRTYRNSNGTRFIMQENPLTGKYAYPMGIAVGDYNSDGYIDFFFSNTGSSVPIFLARGDLADEDEFVSEWILFRNDGDFKFTNTATETKVADFEFSWGAIFQDFNLDGRQDLVVAENYVDFPPHKLFKLPCRFLLQREDGTFSAVEDQANTVNKNYGITPLTSDFNQDGYPDLIYANLNGPVKALINNGGAANYIAFRFPENTRYAGARINVIIGDGSTLSDAYVIGEGLASDQTSTVTFGLGVKSSVESIEIYLADGTKRVLEHPAINQIHNL